MAGLMRTRPRLTGSEAFGNDNNDFALALFEQLRHAPGNLFFSPFSIRTVLAMACSGARGETAAQMGDVLRMETSGDTPHIAFSEIIQRLSTVGSGTQEMLVANALWGQPGESLLPEFSEIIARHYHGKFGEVDFRHAEDARKTINKWVEAQTREKIRELIPLGALDAETSLVLTNAICFKGMWAEAFDRGDTEEGVFRLAGGGGVRVPLMQGMKWDLPYVETKGFQAIDLVYEGGDLSMLVLLPGRRMGLPALEERLSATMLRDCVARMDARLVRVFLPRFKFVSGSVDLCDPLATLGMPLAFARLEADFSGMNGKEPPSEESLFISAVLHQAHVEVTEEGTDAFAAVLATLVPTGATPRRRRTRPDPVFRADHPFLFAIRERKSGSILFLGRVSDPTRGG